MPAKKPALAKADKITAIQTPGQVTIHAVGSKPSPNTRVWLEPSMITVFPPEYLLVQEPPAAPDIQIVVPFLSSVNFRSAEIVKTVIVHDAKGRHAVKVRQVTGKK